MGGMNDYMTVPKIKFFLEPQGKIGKTQLWTTRIQGSATDGSAQSLRGDNSKIH
jgi:hypothetical protein